jgi:hypothetical protein
LKAEGDEEKKKKKPRHRPFDRWNKNESLSHSHHLLLIFSRDLPTPKKSPMRLFIYLFTGEVMTHVAVKAAELADAFDGTRPLRSNVTKRNGTATLATTAEAQEEHHYHVGHRVYCEDCVLKQ